MLQAKKKPAVMGVTTGTRKRESGSVFNIIALLLAVVMLLWQFWPQKTVEVEKTYSVRIGETVWHIANDVKSQGDVRELDEIIWQIKQDNGIKDERSIHAGDKVSVWMHLPEKGGVEK